MWRGEPCTRYNCLRHIDKLLSQYEHKINMQVVMQQETRRRGAFSPNRTAKEAFIWEMIYDNAISFYKNE
jgi:PadR family transcriptional regulator AphA